MGDNFHEAACMRRVARDVIIVMVVVDGGDIFPEQGAVELLEACKRR